MATQSSSAVPWRDQWASLYFYMPAPGAIDFNAVFETVLRPALQASWKAPTLPETASTPVAPRVRTYMDPNESETVSFTETVIEDAPYREMVVAPETRFVHAFKWNVRTNDGSAVDAAKLGALRAALRNAFVGTPYARGNLAAKNTGVAFSPDYGVPAIPQIPNEGSAAAPPGEEKPTGMFENLGWLAFVPFTLIAAVLLDKKWK